MTDDSLVQSINYNEGRLIPNFPADSHEVSLEAILAWQVAHKEYGVIDGDETIRLDVADNVLEINVCIRIIYKYPSKL